jgi:hypothetical protein
MGIGSASGSEDRGFESPPGRKVLGFFYIAMLSFSLIRIVLVKEK